MILKKKNLTQKAQDLFNSSSFWNVKNLQPENSIIDKNEAINWLKNYLLELEKVLHQVAVDAWNYFTLASPISKQNLDEAKEIARKFLKTSAKQARQFNIKKIFSNDSDTSKHKLQLQLIIKEGMNVLNEEDYKNYNLILYNINQIYSKNLICDVLAKENNPCIYKFADLLSLLQNTYNAEESLKWWLSWKQTAGLNLTKNYIKLVQISNKGAKLNNHKNLGEMWRSAYDTDNFNLIEQMEMSYQKILPFYEQLHAYFRPRLAAIYQTKIISEDVTRDGPLPIHLLKNLNGENWINHYELTKPFADETVAISLINKSNIDTFDASSDYKDLNQSLKLNKSINYNDINEEILSNFKAQNYTVKKMFTKIYRYMKYLGFEKLPTTLWSKSIFSKNWSKDMICNPATAYDMYDSTDYRIKICAQLTQHDFIDAHKLFVQLYYKYLSRQKSILMRDAPNPSLSCAISSAFGILAKNFDYLKAMGLINKKIEYSESYVINELYKEALKNFVELPFLIIADKWRYFVFENQINHKNWSEEWWKLREEYQGIKKPSIKSIEKLIDTIEESEKKLSAKYFYSLTKFDSITSPAITLSHAPAAKNFVCYVLQFQILKILCNETNFLSQGCIPNKKKILKIINVMSQGASISWVNAMEKLTGSKNLDLKPLLEYYEPLINWLKNSNKHENVVIGWKKGEGKAFKKNEIPKLKKKELERDQNLLLSDEQFAYPGQSCKNGQECLLDSVCNNSICVCKQGLFTLTIADTYNCVPDDPAKAGFADKNGSFVIALNPINFTVPNSTINYNKSNNNKKDNVLLTPTNTTFSVFKKKNFFLVLFFILMYLLVCLIFCSN